MMGKTQNLETAFKLAEKVIGYTCNHFSVDKYVPKYCVKSLSPTLEEFSRFGFVGLLLSKAAGVSADSPSLNWSLRQGPAILPDQYLVAEAVQLLISANQLSKASSYSTLINSIVSQADANLARVQRSDVLSELKTSFSESNFCRLHTINGDDISKLTTHSDIIHFWEKDVKRECGNLSATGFSLLLSLAEHDYFSKERAHEIGLNYAFATKLYQEIRSNYLHAREERLTLNLPLLLYMQTDSGLIENPEEYFACSLQTYKIQNHILNSPAFKTSLSALDGYVNRAKSALTHFKECKAKEAIINLLEALKL